MSGTGIMSLFISHPILLLIADHIFGKKGISNKFYTQTLPKILRAMRIFNFRIMNYLQKVIRIKYLKERSVQQNYLL